jgi:hypothetical protein
MAPDALAQEKEQDEEQDLLGDIERTEQRCRGWLDRLVARTREGREGVPPKTIELTLTAGAPLIYAVRRILQDRRSSDGHL